MNALVFRGFGVLVSMALLFLMNDKLLPADYRSYFSVTASAFFLASITRFGFDDVILSTPTPRLNTKKIKNYSLVRLGLVIIIFVLHFLTKEYVLEILLYALIIDKVSVLAAYNQKLRNWFFSTVAFHTIIPSVVLVLVLAGFKDVMFLLKTQFLLYFILSLIMLSRICVYSTEILSDKLPKRLWIGINNIVGQFLVYGIVFFVSIMYSDSDFVKFNNSFKVVQLGSLGIMLLNFKWSPILGDVDTEEVRKVYRKQFRDSVALSSIFVSSILIFLEFGVFQGMFDSNILYQGVKASVFIQGGLIVIGPVGYFAIKLSKEVLSSFVSIMIAIFVSILIGLALDLNVLMPGIYGVIFVGKMFILFKAYKGSE